jgi:hypothetical protein
MTEGNSFDVERTQDLLNRHCDNALVRSSAAEPVLCIDDDFNVGAEVCDLSNAVRVQPDDWPPYAEQAWAPLELAQNHGRLRASVIQMDRRRLTDPDDVTEVD